MAESAVQAAENQLAHRILKLNVDTIRSKKRHQSQNAVCRSRCVKDFHSLRHTYIYKLLTGSPPVTLPIVQSMVGHVDDRITRVYMDHATDKHKQQQVGDLRFY